VTKEAKAWGLPDTCTALDEPILSFYLQEFVESTGTKLLLLHAAGGIVINVT
jgi:hypothetical protein